MDIGAVLIKLKTDSLSQVDTWQNELEKRKVEAVETLKAENVFIESWFYVEVENQHYLIAYMRADDIAHAQKVAKTSTFDIDQVHKQFKTTWDKVYPAKLLVDLDNS